MSRYSYNIDAPSTAAQDALYHGRGPSLDSRLRGGYSPQKEPQKRDPYDVRAGASKNRALRRQQPESGDEDAGAVCGQLPGQGDADERDALGAGAQGGAAGHGDRGAAKPAGKHTTTCASVLKD